MVVVPVVPDVVVAVVLVVDVALVFVIIVPDVSVEVPAGMADVDVPLELVSVAMVPIVSVLVVAEVSVMVVLLVSVALVVDSFLHAKPNSATATMVRKTRIVLFMSFLLLICVVWF